MVFAYGRHPFRALTAAYWQQNMQDIRDTDSPVTSQQHSLDPRAARDRLRRPGKCNLYSMTKSQEAICALAKAVRDLTGNLAPLPAVLPDKMAPVVRTAPDGVRELTMMRWGFPLPPRGYPKQMTNVRNSHSNYWRPWLGNPPFSPHRPSPTTAPPSTSHYVGVRVAP
jgi:hypothetical protein